VERACPGLAAAGVEFARAELPETVIGHLKTLNQRLQLGVPGTETDQNALSGTAFLHRKQVALDQYVIDPWRGLSGGSNSRKAHCLDLAHKLLGNLSTQFSAGLDLLRRLRFSTLIKLTRDCGLGGTSAGLVPKS
jgi:hypothetical protein